MCVCVELQFGFIGFSMVRVSVRIRVRVGMPILEYRHGKCLCHNSTDGKNRYGLSGLCTGT